MTIRERLRALLFPRVRCLGCDEPREIDPGQPLCDACRMELEGLRLLDQVCPHCLSAMRHGEPAITVPMGACWAYLPPTPPTATTVSASG